MGQETRVAQHGKSGRVPQGPERDVLNIVPEGAGPRRATSKGGVIYSVRASGAQAFRAKEHFARIMLAPMRRLKASLGNDRMYEYDALAGSLIVTPANVENAMSWSSTMESVIIALTPEALDELAVQEFGSARVELQPPPFGTVDPATLQIAEFLKVELMRQEPSSELFVDSMITAFGIHLLRNYSNLRKPPTVVTGGLSGRGARAVEKFLAENFSRPVTIAELAEVAGLSRRHFMQAFTRTFGKPPHQYLIAMRLNFAEALLRKGELAIVEVAYLSGFSSQSHLTAVMKQYKGLTPAAIRRSK